MLLKDKVCLILGAASLRSIGYGTAELFAEHGAKVVVADLKMDAETLNTVKSAIQSKVGSAVSVHGFSCDISKPSDCDQLVREVIALHGTIDCLVNSAGIVKNIPILELAEKDLDLMFDINLKGAFYICQSVLKVFAENKSGTIVNVASSAAQRGGGLVGGSHYAASKGGMLSLTKSIAREFAALGIRANSICPAMIETPMLDGLSEERLKGIVDAIPLKRVGTTREMAGACLFLSSELSGFVTGSNIDVNGGTHIH
jgi:NAD(P)-dependent dehydrogenase (short-subunit alcohol dehydrogenase family)